jgi:two-component system, NtrC family, sensor kinase
MSDPILIVDDSLTVRMDLVEAFEAAGFQTVPCATVGEAREAMARQRVSLLILDVLLPDADGIEFLRELRSTQNGAELPVLLLSTEAEVRDRIRGLTTGANEYVGKPYDTGHVVARATELVRTREVRTSGGSPTILVIDDSLTYREELASTLQAEGYRVLRASSGEEGLRLAASARPDAVVVDGVLPGADGATVIRRIRLDAALRRMACVLLTASDDRDAELRAYDAGADAFVRKEESASVVLARLAAVLRTRAGEEAKAPGTSLLAPKKVLAVDDSPTYLSSIAAALTDAGYDVVCARSGEEALELLAIQPVDCILLDLMMPGMGGQETCRRIKAAPSIREIPLIMLTALEDRQTMVEGLGAGADDFIAKSSELEVLKARVLAQIRRRQFEDENRRLRDQLLKMEIAEARAALAEELERKNQELEAFSYSVSHDLRAPLRVIEGFSQAALEAVAPSAGVLAVQHLQRVRAAASRMSELIDDLLELSRVGRAELRRDRVDVSRLAAEVLSELQKAEPERRIQVAVHPRLTAEADPRLMRIVLENLLGNAWKFTSKKAEARIEVGAGSSNGRSFFFVRDDGAGFNPKYAARLFSPFQRLHQESDFKGTGIGLATVQRIIERHGGRVWAESAPGQGATFSWELPARHRDEERR